MELRDKVLLITGASSGIGRALAVRAAGEGARLAVLARRGEELRFLAEELAQSGAEVLVLPADVTNREQVAAAVDQTKARFGRLDAVVNNAGLGYFGGVASMPPADFEAVIRTNICGPFHVIQAAVPHLKETRGMIVNISSALSKRALPFLAAYAGSKAMLDALSDGLRLELRKYGIQVLTYCPPEVETGFDARALREPGLPAPAPRRKKAGPEEIAADILRAMKAGKREVVRGKSLMIMNFFAPRLVDRIFYRVMVERFDRGK